MLKWISALYKIPMVKITRSEDNYKKFRPQYDVYTPCDIQNDPSLEKQWRSQTHYCNNTAFILPTPNGTHIKDVIERI